MSTMLPFLYRDFYDVPRVMLVRRGAVTFLLDCPFDETRDEYDAEYTVYLMTALQDSDLRGDWRNLLKKTVRMLGKIPVSQVHFDHTKRKEIDSDVLAQFAG